MSVPYLIYSSVIHLILLKNLFIYLFNYLQKNNNKTDEEEEEELQANNYFDQHEIEISKNGRFLFFM